MYKSVKVMASMATVCVLTSYNVLAMEMPEEIPQSTFRNLSFVYEKDYPEHSQKLEKWLISKIESNQKAKELLESSLENGPLAVILHHNYHNYASYEPDNRKINLKIDFLTSLFPNHRAVTDELLNGNFGCNHILRTLIFELGNSVNEPVLSILPHQYSTPEGYARAMEIGEFETQNITIPVYEYGVKYCHWNKEAFVYSDLETLKKIAYEGVDEHFQFYVQQYNEMYIESVAAYYGENLRNQILGVINAFQEMMPCYGGVEESLP